MHPGLHSQLRPNKLAFVSDDGKQQTTYRQLDEQSNQTAHFLSNLGLKHRDGIAILLDNDLRFLTIAWAAQRSGLYFTPISTFFQAMEVNYILENCEARVLFTKQSILDQTDLTLPPYLTVVTLDQGPSLFWDTAISDFPITPQADAREGAEMIYSSGTTGLPKGVRFDLALSPVGTGVGSDCETHRDASRR